MKYLVYLALLASIACLAGCLLFSPPGTANMAPGGVGPASIFTEVTYPSAREAPFVRYTFTREDLEILGVVRGTGESINILGILSTGDNGFGSMMAQARQKYPTMDGVMNIQWDTKYNGICLGFLYSKVDSSVEAVAVRYKRPVESK
ncbi:MAG: hypothetical protein L6437_01120 [Kiritimatiellae bacterium]|nr:hypothetical protein [Verrucomicrobiota bacterium]MBU4365662.1 hypothetical protein [Verrucomicrobiota bacterium]MCG2658833.1 hypothetical protein [Kiritimatiellia bacterium]